MAQRLHVGESKRDRICFRSPGWLGYPPTELEGGQ